MRKKQLLTPRFYFPLILVVALFVLPIFTSNPLVLRIFIFTFLFASFAEAWSILGQWTGQLSVGHAAFFGIGAYTSTLLLLNFDITPWVGILIGGVMSALAAFLLGIPSFRFKGAFYVLATIVFTDILRRIFINEFNLTGGMLGLTIPYLGDSIYYLTFRGKHFYYYFVLSMMLVFIFITYKTVNSSFGLRMRCVSNSEEASSSIGINVRKIKLEAAALSGFLTGVCGTVFAQYQFFIDPQVTMTINRSCDPIILAVFGGQGIVGPIIGAFLLRPIYELAIIFLGSSFGGLSTLSYGLVLILIMLFMPEGLMPRLRKAYQKMIILLPTLRKGELNENS